MAAYNGHTETVHALLTAGAAVDDKNADGASAVSDAVTKGHVKTVAALLSAGAAMESEGVTVAHVPAADGVESDAEPSNVL